MTELLLVAIPYIVIEMAICLLGIKRHLACLAADPLSDDVERALRIIKLSPVWPVLLPELVGSYIKGRRTR